MGYYQNNYQGQSRGGRGSYSGQNYQGRGNYQGQNFQGQQKPYVKKSGAKYTEYKNKEGQVGQVITAWNASKAGFLSLKAYPLTDSGAKKIAEVKGYSKDYGFETSNGNERWFYKSEFTKRGERAKEYISGIAIFKRSQKKLYVPRFSMVASCNPGMYGKGSFTRSFVSKQKR